MADPRSVAKVLNGDRVKPLVFERVVRAAQTLGVPVPPTRAA
jgi:hypothetical protein